MDAYQMSRLAEECAARHRIPKSSIAHPAGVIVQGDDFMTEKLQDPDYVPYCGPCTPMQRVRRVADGFQCPRCGNKMNFDLTHFNGNVDVKYDRPAPGPTMEQWNERVDARKSARAARRAAQ